MGVGGVFSLPLVPMVPVGDAPVRESLHTSRDKGSKGFPGLAWLYWQQKIRGVLVADLYHEDWNGLKRAAVIAGVWLPILERFKFERYRTALGRGMRFTDPSKPTQRASARRAARTTPSSSFSSKGRRATWAACPCSLVQEATMRRSSGLR